MERDYVSRAIDAVKDGQCEMLLVVPSRDGNVLPFPMRDHGETLIPEAEFLEAARDMENDIPALVGDEDNISSGGKPEKDVYYEIWQLKEDPSTDEMRFESYESITSAGLNPEKANYRKVYGGTTERDLEGLFEQFNIDIPADYKAHSLSVSDVVFYDGDYFYVDSFGFRKIWEELPIDPCDIPFAGPEDINEEEDFSLWET